MLDNIQSSRIIVDPGEVSRVAKLTQLDFYGSS